MLNGRGTWLLGFVMLFAMEALKAEIDELKAKLKKAEEDKEKVGKRWQEEKNEILVNAQEVVSEGERRMEESVKEV